MPSDVDRYVFLVFTWGPGDDEREVFGPFLVRQDDSHLQEITAQAQRWMTAHPGRANSSAELFLTVSADLEG
ncbi:MAG TPA: hypothetical protein VFU47_11065 [Armatimonadota bacterium]|nr:hypothetical protein [Armatimonadota bacterium]